MVTFGPDTKGRTFKICENLSARVSSEGKLNALMISNIIDDIAGQELTDFRRHHKLSVRPV